MKSSLLGWEEMLNFDRVFKPFLYKFLLFEIAMTSEDILTASLKILGGQGSLKKQKFLQDQRNKTISSIKPHFCNKQD